MKDRAKRISHNNRIKIKVKNVLTKIFGEKEPSKKRIGQMYSTHLRPCSCELCRNKHVKYNNKIDND